jgi:Flp pilus assembly protein TadG
MIARRTVPAGQRGSSLAEFAIAFTASMLLIMGIVDFGRALYTYHLISDIARMGTRYAIVRGASCTATGCPATTSTVQTYVRGLAPELSSASITVNTTWSTTSSCNSSPANSAGCQVAVQVTYPFRFAATPLLPNFAMSITSTSTMIISQ